ncbi:MAG: AraC family transcriptional regulator [Clostridia bacterium]|nr:AraC family transcriptional regulator [Clostridia bacterium]
MSQKYRNYFKEKIYRTKFHKQRSVASKIMLSYLLVLIIPIAICGIMEFFVISLVQSEVRTSGMLTVENARVDIDGLIGDMDLIYEYINSNENITTIYEYAQTKNDYELRKSINELRNVAVSTNNVDDIFIYSGNSEMVITSEGRSFAKSFVESKYSDTDITYEKWIKDIENLKGTKYRIIYHSKTKDVAYVEYIAPLTGKYIEYYNSANKPFPAVMIIRMNINAFTLSEQIQKYKNDICLYIVDPDGMVIGNGGADVDAVLSETNGNTTAEFSVGGKKYICAKSNRNEWIYAASVSVWKYNYYGILSSVIVVLGSIIILLLGIGLLRNYIRTNYGGIIRVNELLHREKKVPDDNDLNSLSRYFEVAILERHSLVETIKKKDEVIFENYIIRLLNGVNIKADDQVHIREKMPTDKFMVLCCNVESCERLYEGSIYSELSLSEKSKDALYIVKNVIEEMLGEKYYVISAVVNSGLAIIAGAKECGLSQEDIYYISEHFADVAEKKFKIACVISISNPVYEYHNISDAYMKVRGLRKYSLLLRDSHVIYEDQYSDRNDVYHLTPQEEREIYTNIVGGNIAGTIDVINELFRENIEVRKLSYEMIECFLIALGKIYESVIINEDMDYDASSIIPNMLRLDKIFEIETYMYDLTKNLCDELKSNKSNGQQELVEQIRQYIDSHYDDSNINVYSIADTFAVSRNYISKLYKQYNGEGILYAIHRRRTDKAESLLSSDMSIGEIAQKVGYANASVFIKTFKKYKGVTPGQYRDNL